MSTISSGTTLTTALVQTGDTTGELVIQTDNGNTTAATFTTVGNVGLGTSSPANYVSFGYGPTVETRGGHGGTFLVSNSGNTLLTALSNNQDENAGYLKTITEHALAFGTDDTERMRIDSSGNVGIGNTPSGTYKLQVSGLVSDTAGNLRSLPLNSQTSAYVAAATDNGKVISITTGGVTINNSVFSAGMVLTIYNNSGSSQTITQGAGVTMQWAGQSSSTTGSRTLGLYGMATVYFLSASSAVITGSGLT